MSQSHGSSRPAATSTEYVLRNEAPHVLGALVRRFGRFELAEDAAQEALLTASQRWPSRGIPQEPRSWLIRVGYRKMVDLLRSEQASHRREEEAAQANSILLDPSRAGPTLLQHDDSLDLLFLCCHPALSATSQVALTLRAVGGLTTEEIAHAYGASETTMGVRISRAKKTLKRTGARFEICDEAEATARISTVMEVLYLIFNEGYTTCAGDVLTRVDLTHEAIRLARLLHRTMPDHPEAVGLLALMVLTEARREARTDVDDNLVTLVEQDRQRWNVELIAEGRTLVEEAWAQDRVGPYQLQAAIAALHTDASDASDTDWPQIAALYLWLERLQPTNAIRLSRVVAVTHAFGPRRGLALLNDLDRDYDFTADPLVAQRAHAVRAHIHDLLGEHELARPHFEAAAALSRNAVEQRYLQRRLDTRGDKGAHIDRP